MLLFSYGSNNIQQLTDRLGHAPRNPRAASAAGKKRVFRGHSRNWGGGVATLIPAARSHVTYGFVVNINEADREILDSYEGASYALTQIFVDVEGERLPAVAYIRPRGASEPATTPSRKYLEAIAKTVGAFWSNEDGSRVTWRDFGVEVKENPSLVDKEQAEHPWLTRAQARHIVADHRRVRGNPVGVEKVPFEWGMTRERQRQQGGTMGADEFLDRASLSNRRKLFRETVYLAVRDAQYGATSIHKQRARALVAAMAADAQVAFVADPVDEYDSESLLQALLAFIAHDVSHDQLDYYQTFLPIRADYELPVEELDAVLEVLSRYVDDDWRLQKLMSAKTDAERGAVFLGIVTDLATAAAYSGVKATRVNRAVVARSAIEELVALRGVEILGERVYKTLPRVSAEALVVEPAAPTPIEPPTRPAPERVYRRRPKGNPCHGNPTGSVIESIQKGVQSHYEWFHGYEPDRVMQLGKAWVPGDLVCIGAGVDVGYDIAKQPSKKDGWYVHDFGKSVRVYRRAKSGERYDKTIRNFPKEVLVLGKNLGFTYCDADGKEHEVKGSSQKYLTVTPNRRTLVVVGPSGVEYVLEGGKMRVEDWIRD